MGGGSIDKNRVVDDYRLKRKKKKGRSARCTVGWGRESFMKA